jgi:hypothetical protein
MKALPKGSASSKRAASDQGGPGAAGSSQRRKEGKYTLDAALNQPDQIKTSFITPYGAYCYVTMPFGLKNAGATYQLTMQRCLRGQIGRNMHAYVDDMVVKAKQSGTLLNDLKETFANLRRYRMKLNPEKCTFGMPAGQLLGYIVSQHGIESNPSKIKAIEALEPPT